jgi:predicted ATPase with chaperone activity
MNFHKMFAKLVIERKPNDRPFDEILGCENITRLFRMALNSAEPVHILLSGPPASAKTLCVHVMPRNNPYLSTKELIYVNAN